MRLLCAGLLLLTPLRTLIDESACFDTGLTFGTLPAKPWSATLTLESSFVLFGDCEVCNGGFFASFAWVSLRLCIMIFCFAEVGVMRELGALKLSLGPDLDVIGLCLTFAASSVPDCPENARALKLLCCAVWALSYATMRLSALRSTGGSCCPG